MNDNSLNAQTNNRSSPSFLAINSLAKQNLLTSSDTQSIDAKIQQKLALHSKDDSPWFIQLFLSVSGLLSGLSLIGFLALLFGDALDSSLALSIIGVILLCVSFGLFKQTHKKTHTFFSSLAFAISIAGQIFLAVAIFRYSLFEPVDVGLFMLIQMVLFILIPDFLHRLLSSLITLACLVWLMSYFGAPEAVAAVLALITAVFGLQRYELLNIVSANKRTAILQMSRSLAYASAIMLLIVSVYFITAEYGNNIITGVVRSGSSDLFFYNYPLAQGLLILVAVYTAYITMRRYRLSLFAHRNKVGMIVVASITLLGILSVYASGLLAASIVCVIAVANRQRVLLSLAIIAMVSYIFWYYYQLDTTLLVKSLSLLAVGLSVLIIRWILVQKIFAKFNISNRPLISTTELNSNHKRDNKESDE